VDYLLLQIQAEKAILKIHQLKKKQLHLLLELHGWDQSLLLHGIPNLVLEAIPLKIINLFC
jgi:hypothetical protein